MLAESVTRLLERKGLEIVYAASVEAALSALKDQEFSVVISDYSLGMVGKGDAVLAAVADKQPHARRILMSGEKEAERFAKNGLAHIFYLKDSKLARALMAEIATAEVEAPTL